MANSRFRLQCLPGLQTNLSCAYSASPTHLPVGWLAVASAVKTSQPHGVRPVSFEQVIPSCLVPRCQAAKH